MNWLSDKYNRSYSLRLPFTDNLSELTIYYNKNNLYTAFVLDQNTYEKFKRTKDYSNIIFFDLNKSLFSNTFLDMKSFKTDTLDIKNKYNNIFPQHRDNVNCELSETIQLSKHKVPWDKYPQYNSLSINVFRLSLYESNFIYVLAERQIIDPVLSKKIIRTSSIQLSTGETTKYISSIASKCNTVEVKRQTTEEALRSIFNNDKKLDRCGVL